MFHVGGGARIYRSDGCGASVKLDDFGRVSLITGASEIGQGSETVLAMIIAETLGVPLERVDVVNSDTAVKPWDVGVTPAAPPSSPATPPGSPPRRSAPASSRSRPDSS